MQRPIKLVLRTGGQKPGFLREYFLQSKDSVNTFDFASVLLSECVSPVDFRSKINPANSAFSLNNYSGFCRYCAAIIGNPTIALHR